MKEILAIYKIVDSHLCQYKDCEKIEKIINKNESFINLEENHKTLIINYIKTQSLDMKRIKDTNSEDVKKNTNNKTKKLKSDDKILKKSEISVGERLSSQLKAVQLKKVSDEEYKERKEIFEALERVVLPEQRSPEWFTMREGKITASDGGAVINLNKYEPQCRFIYKKVYGSTFETNQACYHGKKFEEAVTMMYEYQNDVKTREFGLMGHNKYSFLGASPDGICSPYKRNGKTKSDLVGRMLEIKCPLMRKIKFTGEIKDEICPVYYWCQVQLQLECCNLPECDFIQCNIEEYESKDEWIEDTDDIKEYLSKQNQKERGVIIEMVPTDLTDDDYDKDGKVKLDTIYNKAEFIYPSKIDMTNKQTENWIKKTSKSYKSIYDIREKQLNKTLDLDEENSKSINRVLFWKLKERNCTLIERDTEWFNSNVGEYKRIWDHVLFLRTNEAKANQWKTLVDAKMKEHEDKLYNNFYIKKLAEKSLSAYLVSELEKIIIQ